MRDLELEVRGRNRRRNRGEFLEGSGSIEESWGKLSYQNNSR